MMRTFFLHLKQRARHILSNLFQSFVSFAKRFKSWSTESGECDVSDVDKHCGELSECKIFESSFEHEKGKSARCCM